MAYRMKLAASGFVRTLLVRCAAGLPLAVIIYIASGNLALGLCAAALVIGLPRLAR